MAARPFLCCSASAHLRTELWLPNKFGHKPGSFGLLKPRHDNHSVSAIEYATREFAAQRSSRSNRQPNMRLSCTLLLTLLGTTFLALTDAALSTSQETELQLANSRTRGTASGPRFLRKNGATSPDDEERMGVKEIVGRLGKAVKTKAKMKFWLHRGTTPEKVLEKLKVTSTTDENYKLYSKYYAKFPGRQPSSLSAKTADEIMKTRMRNWLDSNLTPPQAFKELRLTGTFASARGQPDFKYFEQYSAMWGKQQARLSKADARKR
jgi:hypothetical protein